MKRRASRGTVHDAGMGPIGFHAVLAAALFGLTGVIGSGPAGCAQRAGKKACPEPLYSGPVIVVAPVLNLSGTPSLDALKITDTLASEFVASKAASVVPVNLTLAALARRGKSCVETPQDAIELAREFAADATVVMAITDYSPYDPPRIGLVLQWYAPGGPSGTGSGAELSADAAAAPRFQLQRVFDASQNQVQSEVRHFARHHSGDESPYGWRKVLQSQELYVRYSCWAAIKSMPCQTGSQRADAATDEVEP